MTSTPIDWTAVAHERSIVDIGQIPANQRRRLDRLAKRGEIAKWRGYWNTGTPHFGIGPLKTWFGPINPASTTEEPPR